MTIYLIFRATTQHGSGSGSLGRWVRRKYTLKTDLTAATSQLHRHRMYNWISRMFRPLDRRRDSGTSCILKNIL